jgi:hypothetical protein
MGVSNPLSARKTREYAFKAVEATNKQATALGRLEQEVRQLRDALAQMFFARTLFGRLRFILVGK